MAYRTFVDLKRESRKNIKMVIEDNFLRGIYAPASLDIELKNSDNVDMEWLGEFAKFKEFKDSRKIETLKDFFYNIKTKTWENTIGITRKAWDKNPETITPRLKKFSLSYLRHLNERFFNVVNNGETILCYDGQALFSTSHPIDGSTDTNSNLITGAGVAEANIRTDFYKAIKAMETFKMRDGEYYFDNIGEIVRVLHPPALREVMAKVFRNSLLTNGGTNDLAGQAFPVSCPRLSDANDWYVELLGLDVKPYVYVVSSPLEDELLGANRGDGSDIRFMQDKVAYGLRVEDEFAPGVWQAVVKVKNT